MGASSLLCDSDHYLITVKVIVTLRLAINHQSVRLGEQTLEAQGPSIFFQILSDERMDLSFAITAGPRQRSHSRFRVPQDS
jgi:hypothetical protein